MEARWPTLSGQEENQTTGASVKIVRTWVPSQEDGWIFAARVRCPSFVKYVSLTTNESESWHERNPFSLNIKLYILLAVLYVFLSENLLNINNSSFLPTVEIVKGELRYKRFASARNSKTALKRVMSTLSESRQEFSKHFCRASERPWKRIGIGCENERMNFLWFSIKTWTEQNN